MKIIHTSDWHLGQKLLHNDREQEHRLALQWLLETIRKEKADGLIVAGDIFDIGNPPNYARSLYYQFLRNLLNTECRHVVITGGNHDSPAMLNAPRELLQALNVHVIGAAGEGPEDEVVVWKSPEDEIEVIIAAVPFLRDRDIRYSVAGETGLERVAQIKTEIRKHYGRVADHIAGHYDTASVPVICTGHLYASGASASGKQDNIYIGNTENIDAQHFPDLFDYVALGHIHRAQKVGGLEHVRYSGSLIPLSFSETQDEKGVYVLEWEGKKLETVRTVGVPTFRRLKQISGSLEEVKNAIERFVAKERAGDEPWIEVLVDLDRVVPELSRVLQDIVDESGGGASILKIQARYPNRESYTEQDVPDLDSLEAEAVFRMKCEQYGSPPDQMDELLATFRELQSWMSEHE
ncbi:MAG: exonuclease SbcCD subunit D C-terminal domain-containing protein [Mameliella sp.]|nr:exonuclease SbcCD subunit D C-terminal domain-containing protein [Phaeodactylibacter sp.]